ncbi:trigger factor [Sandaracinobacter sp. RS1-74]|uniref:trigger factor n=1 Tax=Sandaracinobacteroides sayramensis TaxID=2913411 RepID=UPI001EDC58CC|nr:trigger factor [Sandaracinobacteroides sayramensis]MCG2839911.1 trigger factor [Sandaracinobacteroides sayramensis]
MTATETLNDGLKRAYELVIGSDAIAAKVDAAIAQVAPQVRMPGFRPGKVPGNLIRKMHGPSLRREALQEAVNEAVNRLMADKGLRPAIQPQVDLDGGLNDGEDVKISVSLEVLPDVPDAEVEGIALERLTVEVSDAEVEASLKRLAEGQKSFEDAPAKHKAKEGDLVVMDYAGTADGVAFEGGTGEAMEIELGSGRLIPGFEDGLVGVKAGDSRTVKVTFPADYPAENLAGKDAQFAVTVTAVKLAKEAVVDESFATNLGLDSLDKLKEILKDQVESELNGLTRTYLKRKLLDHLAAAHSFDVPPSMVDAEFQQIWAQVEASASDEEKAGMEAERGDYGRIAERRVRLGLLLSDIGQKNGVQVTQGEMNRLVAQEAARYPGQEREVQKYFAENAIAAAQLRAPLFEEKVVDFLLGKASITDRQVSRSELEAAIESEDETPLSALPHGAPGHVHGPDCDHGHDHDHDHGAKPAKKAAPKKAVKAEAAEDAVTAEAVTGEAVAEEAPKPAKKPAARKAAAPKEEAAAEGEADAPKKAPARKKAAK